MRSVSRALSRFNLFAGAILVFAAPMGASAAVVFDNLNTPTGFKSPQVGGWYGESFTVGGSNVTLSSVELNMDTAGNSSGNFFVSLFSNGVGNVPSTLLESLAGTSNPAAAGTYTYTGSSLLLANTTYWVVTGVSSGSGVYKLGIEAPSNIELGSTFGYTASFDSAASWQGPFGISLSSA